jgi:hypothetical protein
MVVARSLLVALALLLGTWLGYDGIRALVRGDYTTPSSGPYAQQLGPWARLLELVGVNPRGTAIKALHVLLGLAWYAGALAFLLRSSIGPRLLLTCAIGSLWYLPFGTVVGAAEIALLVRLRKKGAA